MRLTLSQVVAVGIASVAAGLFIATAWIAAGLFIATAWIAAGLFIIARGSFALIAASAMAVVTLLVHYRGCYPPAFSADDSKSVMVRMSNRTPPSL
jgi:hypothetical protein